MTDGKNTDLLPPPKKSKAVSFPTSVRRSFNQKLEHQSCQRDFLSLSVNPVVLNISLCYSKEGKTRSCRTETVCLSGTLWRHWYGSDQREDRKHKRKTFQGGLSAPAGLSVTAAWRWPGWDNTYSSSNGLVFRTFKVKFSKRAFWSIKKPSCPSLSKLPQQHSSHEVARGVESCCHADR